MYKEKWEALSLTKQKVLQIIAGMLLAAASLYFLYSSSLTKQSIFDFNVLIAFAILLIIPRILEAQISGRLRVLRIYMLVFFIIGFIGMFLLGFVFKA